MKKRNREKKLNLKSSDLKIGMRIGDYEVISLPNQKENRKTEVSCRCGKCTGEPKRLYTYSLTSGMSLGCGSASRERLRESRISNGDFEDVVGKTINNRQILSWGSERNMVRAKCLLCDAEKEVLISAIRRSKSCGCDMINNYKETMVQKYGVDHSFKHPDFKEKAKQTNLEKYGVENPMQSEEVKKKVEETSLERYGVKNWAHLKVNYKHRLSSGELISDFSKKNKIPYSTALNTFKEMGEIEFLKWASNFESAPTSLERLFINLMRDIFPEIAHYNKKAHHNLSYKPDFRLANKDRVVYINTDGLYYHSEEARSRKNAYDEIKESETGAKYHLTMRKDFESNGIRLMQFYESEIRDKGEIVKSMILNGLLLSPNKIYARNTEIVSVDWAEASLFLEENHLMGKGQPGKCLALKHDGQILCVISYKIWDRKKSMGTKISIERFASKKLTSVIGGFSKLLEEVKRRNPDSDYIESFCDLRYASGGSYEKNGFTKESEYVGLWWTDTVNVFNRRVCRAGNGKSQEENAKEMGLFKIYDAGQRKYVFKLKSEIKTDYELGDKTEDVFIIGDKDIRKRNRGPIKFDIGQVINDWTILGIDPIDQGRLLVQCSCGKKASRFKQAILGTNKTPPYSRSCGCKRRGNAIKNNDGIDPITKKKIY